MWVMTRRVAVRRGMLAGVRRPLAYKIGAILVGAMGGLQVGLWRMRARYNAIDPSGELRARLEVLFRAAQGRGPLPAKDQDEFAVDRDNSNDSSHPGL